MNFYNEINKKKKYNIYDDFIAKISNNKYIYSHYYVNVIL